MTTRFRVQVPVTALVLLGHPAVPEIIRQVDDRREMLVKVIVFENRHPEAFEAVAQLGVAKVIDCLPWQGGFAVIS
jgi:FMN phosphatase YigB (HAD superfamily)